ncbi:hypothetical protein EL84_30360 [Paenibacillus sp. VT-400]|nr:hypothetical protein EL84_30360 [Paenibacillus sp. VT-400]
MEQREEKRRRTEPRVGITHLTMPMLWIMDEKGTINKGYPQWITFICAYEERYTIMFLHQIIRRAQRLCITSK